MERCVAVSDRVRTVYSVDIKLADVAAVVAGLVAGHIAVPAEMNRQVPQ